MLVALSGGICGEAAHVPTQCSLVFDCCLWALTVPDAKAQHTMKVIAHANVLRNRLIFISVWGKYTHSSMASRIWQKGLDFAVKRSHQVDPRAAATLPKYQLVSFSRSDTLAMLYAIDI